MKNSVLNQSPSMIPRCALLVAFAALFGVVGPISAGEKQVVEAQAIYLAAPVWGETSVTPSGNIHASVTAVQMMLSDNPLLNGRLTWTGDFNMDAELNGVGAGTGILEVGAWDSSSEFIPSGDVWVTKFEVKGNMSAAYEGKVVAHGAEGEVQGMRAVLEFEGGAGRDSYSGWILDPQGEE